PMTFRLPDALRTDDDQAALALLGRYFGNGGPRYTGADFDTWDSTGTREEDRNRFTADDMVALSFLSVAIPGPAAQDLIRDRAGEFTELLTALGEDRDLVDEPEPLADDWIGWQLMARLRELDGIAATKASKLLARKRPRLRPIYDTVVAKVTGTVESQWEPVRVALRADNGALHQRLTRLHEAIGLPAQVPPLRVLDVVAWLEGKDKGW
ncbi:MAG: DUF6308 family protein, partial [Mycobacteriaceae bacterium]